MISTECTNVGNIARTEAGVTANRAPRLTIDKLEGKKTKHELVAAGALTFKNTQSSNCLLLVCPRDYYTVSGKK